MKTKLLVSSALVVVILMSGCAAEKAALAPSTNVPPAMSPNIYGYTTEEGELAIRIALSDPEVQERLKGKAYHVKGVHEYVHAGEEIFFIGPAVTIALEEAPPHGRSLYVCVDLDKRKVVEVEPMPERGPVGPYLVRAAPVRAAYSLGEDIEIEFEFENLISKPITITPFPPTIGITPAMAGPNEWKEQVGCFFPAGSEKLDLQPGETAEYTLVWNQQDDNAHQVAPGYYRIYAETEAQVAGEESTHPWGLLPRSKVLVEYPQGVLEKTIKVDQSQTVNGVTITLEYVELSQEGARFYAFTTPPGYYFPQCPTFAQPPQWVSAFAQYTMDGVTKDAGFSKTCHFKNGMRLSWGTGGTWLDPVPSDAKELTFVITKFGDWQGPWEFHIPLE